MVEDIIIKKMEKQVNIDKRVKNAPHCLSCGKILKAEIDPIAKKITGYLWSCTCMPKDTLISIG